MFSWTFNQGCFSNIAINVLFYNYNSKKYYESRENRGAIIIIPIELEIFCSQNIEDSKNYVALRATTYTC